MSRARGAIVLAAVLVSPLLTIGTAANAADARVDPWSRVCDRVLEDFSTSAPGKVPVGWRTRYPEHAAENGIQRLYVVEDVGGRRALHATYGTHTVTLVHALPSWSLEKYPVAAWRWRAVHLPLGGDESSLSTNDSAASVYFVWDVGFPFRVSFVRFAWSSTLPVGRVVTRRLGHDRVVVTESGPAPGGGWREARVDLRAEARILLGEVAPSSPMLLAVTTDADATASSAEAYYADFRLCR